MLASVLLQTAPDWFDQAVIILATLIGLPFVESFVTALIRRFTDATGLNPRAIVYVISGIVAAYVMWQAPPALPVFDSGSPGEFVAAWLVIVNGFAALTMGLYDRLLKELPVFRG